MAVKKKKSGKTTIASYDERSPITGNFTVLVEQIEDDIYKVCMETGYQTYWNKWTEDAKETLAVLERQMPDYVVASKHVSDGGHVWYPLMMASPYGLLHTIMTSDNQLEWAVSDIEPVRSEEESKQPNLLRLPVQTADGVKIALFKVLVPALSRVPLNEFEAALDVYQELVAKHQSDEEE